MSKYCVYIKLVYIIKCNTAHAYIYKCKLYWTGEQNLLEFYQSSLDVNQYFLSGRDMSSLIVTKLKIHVWSSCNRKMHQQVFQTKKTLSHNLMLVVKLDIECWSFTVDFLCPKIISRKKKDFNSKLLISTHQTEFYIHDLLHLISQSEKQWHLLI